MSDPLTVAKIVFIVASAAAEVEPTLKKYQRSAQLAVFPYGDDLDSLPHSVMTQVVKQSETEWVKQPANLVRIDLAKSMCTYKEVGIGFAAWKALADSKLSHAQKMTFEMQFIDFFGSDVSKTHQEKPITVQSTAYCVMSTIVYFCK